MIVSIIVTSYFVIGLKVDEDSYNYEPFSFSLPFPSFRDSTDESYWKEVFDKIYKDYNIPKDAKLYLSTQEEYLLGLDIFSNSTRISDILAGDSLPVVYLGETRGSVKGVISPFIISPTDFYRWFYLAQNINQVENYFYNRRAYGVRKPVSSWEKGFEESLFREKLTFLFENNNNEFFSKTKDLVLSGEGVLYAGDDQRLILSFLDSAISGFWRLYLDRQSVVLNLENIKQANKDVFEKVSDKYQLKDLAGCLVVPSATDIEMSYPDGGKLKVDLQPDSISVVPFEKSNKMNLKVFFDKKEIFVEVTGGELGLVVDNRPRPLLKDKTSKQRINSIDKWLKEISSKVELNSKKSKESQDDVEKLKAAPDISKDQEQEQPKKVPSATLMQLQIAHKLLKEGLKNKTKVKKEANVEPKKEISRTNEKVEPKNNKPKDSGKTKVTNTKNTIDVKQEKPLEEVIKEELYSNDKPDDSSKNLNKNKDGNEKPVVPINRDSKVI